MCSASNVPLLMDRIAVCAIYLVSMVNHCYKQIFPATNYEKELLPFPLRFNYTLSFKS